MTTQRNIRVEAASLHEARSVLKSKIPRGMAVVKDSVIADGKPRTLEGTGSTVDAAFQDAASKTPAETEVIDKVVITQPQSERIIIQACDADTAKRQARSKVPRKARLDRIVLTAKGRRGFLGIGRTPNTYEAHIEHWAIVQVTVKGKAIIEVVVAPPEWKDPDSWVRRSVVQDQNLEQSVLAEIATTDSNEAVRIAAVNKITDKPLLLTVIRDPKHTRISRIAVEYRLNDTDALKDIVRNDTRPAVRVAAAAKLGDETLLGEFASLRGDEDVRIAAIRGIKSPSLLTSIVQQESGEGRESGAVLLEIVKQCDDQEVLGIAATRPRNSYVREMATEKLCDERTLMAIAETDSAAEVRRLAVTRVSDEVLLRDLVRESSFGDVRLHAAIGLKDQKTLREIAEHDADWKTRREAVAHISDPQVLDHIARNDSSPYVCFYAARKSRNNSVLADIAQHSDEPDLRKWAVKELDDEAIVRALSTQDPSEEMREAAAGRLKRLAMKRKWRDGALAWWDSSGRSTCYCDDNGCLVDGENRMQSKVLQSGDGYRHHLTGRIYCEECAERRIEKEVS